MSSNGNGDDDNIDDLIRELRNTNRNLEDVSQNLNRLVNSIIEGSQTGDERRDETIKFDLWDEGTMPSGTASNVREYIAYRIKNANNEQLTVPQLSPNVDIVDFFVEVYTYKAEHLQRIYQGTSNAQWKRFVQELAILYGAERELVELLNPDPITFGLRVIDGEVQVFSSSTHMYFIDAYNNYWFQDGPGIESPNGANGPWETLQLVQPDPADWTPVVPELTRDDINSDLANAIENHPGKRLPEEYQFYL